MKDEKTCFTLLGWICRSSSAGLLPKGRKNPTVMSISICNAYICFAFSNSSYL